MLRSQVQAERSSRRAFEIGFRPVEDVRLDREHVRQRRQTGIRYAPTTGVILAVLGALLRRWIP
jgi:hypothetical protein